MLYLVGIGLKPKHLTIEALDAIKDSGQVFLETYTSAYAEGSLADLEGIAGKKINQFSRKQVEDEEKSILAMAKKNNICLLTFGNPLTATTHVQLLLDAKKEGVKVKIVEGISVTNAIARTGLDEYRFGRTTTIVEPSENYSPESFFDFIEKNFESGLHTLCLLDTSNGEKLMTATASLELLEKIAEKKKKKFLEKTPIILLGGLTSEKEKITAGFLKDLAGKKIEAFPQSIIICGKLTDKEKEALRELHGLLA